MTILSDNLSECLVVEFSFTEGGLNSPTLNIDNRFTNLDTSMSGFNTGEPDALADPLIELKMPENIGSMQEKPARLLMSNKSDLVQLMLREFSIYKIKCNIRKNFFDTSAGHAAVPVEIMYLVNGDCIKITDAPGNKPGMVEILIDNLKMQARKPSGILVTPQCSWTFGDPRTCGIDVESLSQTASLTAISARGFQVTITGLTVPADSPHYFKAGSLYLRGVSMGIRDWDGANEFLLSQRVSYEIWSSVPENVQLTPGCRLFHSDCVYWDNEDEFAGYGITMPAHNPLFEKGND